MKTGRVTEPYPLRTVPGSANVSASGDGRAHLVVKSRGFSLLEVLVAIVVLSLSLGALYSAASSATRGAMVASDYAIATALAQSMLDNARGATVQEANARGVFDQYTWQTALQVMAAGQQASANNSNARQTAGQLGEYRVVVSWPGDRGQRQISLVTFDRVNDIAPVNR